MLRHIAAFLIGGAMMAATPNLALAIDKDAHAYNRVLGRGINLGNTFEEPGERSWGVTLQASDFEVIKEAGFDSVRIPIRWSVHAATEAPYKINPAFFKRVDWAIDQALSRKLAAVINVHHYGEMDRDPVNNFPRLLALWKQIALHIGIGRTTCFRALQRAT
jgi:endoglucanase